MAIPRQKNCEACRRSKRRCDLQRPVCSRCRERRLDCVYMGAPTSGGERTSDTVPVRHNGFAEEPTATPYGNYGNYETEDGRETYGNPEAYRDYANYGGRGLARGEVQGQWGDEVDERGEHVLDPALGVAVDPTLDAPVTSTEVVTGDSNHGTGDFGNGAGGDTFVLDPALVSMGKETHTVDAGDKGARYIATDEVSLDPALGSSTGHPSLQDSKSRKRPPEAMDETSSPSRGEGADGVEKKSDIPS
ncbi:Transcriptional activator protein UGA3 [Elsinoe australis]|uniref:Transcriptional activator protein UGA3 n=1 Tax=Elsinoe australis TaxID=40998 RepID=A0A2P8AFF7_9PEZI|nr:Transcriptional activator protein UGA3 [Elsinoe australis]